MNRIDHIEGQGPTINRLDALTAVERKAFETRNKLLKLSLVPAGSGELRQLLARFFAGYPSLQGYDIDAARKMLDVYEAALIGVDKTAVPLWAVDAALQSYVDRTSHPQYPPTAPELAMYARAELAPFIRETRELDHALAAKPVSIDATQEERDRGFDYWQQQKASWIEPETDRERQARTLRDIAASSDAQIRRINVATGIQDGRPHSLELRLKLKEMGANFGGATGIGDDEYGGLDPGGARDER